MNKIQNQVTMPNQERTNRYMEETQEDFKTNPALSSKILYPTLDVAFSTRINHGRIRNREALLQYTLQMEVTDAQYHNEPNIDPKHLRSISQEDGMVHIFRQMHMNPALRAQRKVLDSNDRQQFIGPKVLICVCMYNEGINAINLTLKGVYENLQSLQEEGISHEEVAVVLVQDGILKLIKDKKRRTYTGGDEMSIIKFYRKMDEYLGKDYCELEDRIHTILDSVDLFARQDQNDLVDKNSEIPPNIEKNVSLLYQSMWWPELTEEPQEGDNRNGPRDQARVPERKLKLFTCFKHLNGKKLSSHLWFFEGFCRYLKPEFIVLLDVGTKPGSSASNNDYNGLTNLIRGFKSDKNIGGTTGLMSIDAAFESLEGGDDEEDKDNCFMDCCASIQKAQEYEYIVAHFLDKNFESFTGFLHVLPGAWSAYRYAALIKSDKYEQNLLQRSYFKPLLDPSLESNHTLDESNMYLAEDRILSLGIYCQKNARFTLKYVPDAVAYTDPMKKHETLLSQRRRWINSSLFAFLYVLRNYYFHVNESDHNCMRTHISINFSMVFAGLSFVNSYFTPALYFFVLYITIAQLRSFHPVLEDIATIVSTIYCFILIAAIGGSLVGKKWEKQAHVVSLILSVFTFGMFALVAYNLLAIYLNIEDLDLVSFKSASVVIMIGINLGAFLLILLVHLPTHAKFVCKMILDTPSYMAYQGAYSQTMVIYGMCNVDDVSWGTKGATGSGGQSKYFEEKVFFVSTWLLLNCLLAYIFIYVDVIVPKSSGSEGGMVLLVIVIYSTIIIGVKSLLAIMNFVSWLLTEKLFRCCQPQENVERNVRNMTEFWQPRVRPFCKAA